MSDSALFRSGHEACRFAYAYSGQQYPMTFMGRMMKGAGLGSGRGLFGLEGAAVAGTVKRHVESLSETDCLIIGARYEINIERQRAYAYALVEPVIAALGTGGHHRHMARALICLYFRIPEKDGEKVKLANLCSQFGMTEITMKRRWQSVKYRLRELESKATVLADNAMADAGLVGRG
jgi:hypothetical protein